MVNSNQLRPGENRLPLSFEKKKKLHLLASADHELGIARATEAIPFYADLLTEVGVGSDVYRRDWFP